MVYESADRMLLLIGADELWVYDTNTDTWEQRAQPGSQADFTVTAAYHGRLDQLITYGGAPTGRTAETWAYDYAADAWQCIDTARPPGPLADHAMTDDPNTDAVYMFWALPVSCRRARPIPRAERWGRSTASTGDLVG